MVSRYHTSSSSILVSYNRYNKTSAVFSGGNNVCRYAQSCQCDAVIAFLKQTLLSQLSRQDKTRFYLYNLRHTGVQEDIANSHSI